MAKKRNRLSVKTILKRDIADIASMTASELRRDIQTMADAITKRIKRFREKGIESPAVRSLYESGGRISTQALSDDELLSEYQRATNFLKNRTSSITEYEKLRKETQKEFAKKGLTLSKEDFYKISNYYNQLKETNPEIEKKGFRYFARGQFADVIAGGPTTLEKAIARMEDMLDMERGEFDGVSEFFEN